MFCMCETECGMAELTFYREQPKVLVETGVAQYH
jgi:hypothetical protein